MMLVTSLCIASDMSGSIFIHHSFSTATVYTSWWSDALDRDGRLPEVREGSGQQGA